MPDIDPHRVLLDALDVTGYLDQAQATTKIDDGDSSYFAYHPGAASGASTTKWSRWDNSGYWAAYQDTYAFTDKLGYKDCHTGNMAINSQPRDGRFRLGLPTQGRDEEHRLGRFDLQALAHELGVRDIKWEGYRMDYPKDTSSLAIVKDPNKCIMCRRCETACNNMQTVGILSAVDRGFDSVVMPTAKRPLSETKCVFCGQCVQACPTGALTIGEKNKMIKKAYARVKQLGGDANVYGDKFVDGTHVVYVLQFKPEVYDELPVKPSVPLSVVIWKDLLKPLSLLGAGGVLAGSFVQYMLHGPKAPPPEGTNSDNEAGKTEGGE